MNGYSLNKCIPSESSGWRVACTDTGILQCGSNHPCKAQPSYVGRGRKKQKVHEITSDSLRTWSWCDPFNCWIRSTSEGIGSLKTHWKKGMSFQLAPPPSSAPSLPQSEPLMNFPCQIEHPTQGGKKLNPKTAIQPSINDDKPENVTGTNGGEIGFDEDDDLLEAVGKEKEVWGKDKSHKNGTQSVRTFYPSCFSCISPTRATRWASSWSQQTSWVSNTMQLVMVQPNLSTKTVTCHSRTLAVIWRLGARLFCLISLSGLVCSRNLFPSAPTWTWRALSSMPRMRSSWKFQLTMQFIMWCITPSLITHLSIMPFFSCRQILQSETGIVESANMLFSNSQGYSMPSPSRIQRTSGRNTSPTNSRTSTTLTMTWNLGYASVLLINIIITDSIY